MPLVFDPTIAKNHLANGRIALCFQYLTDCAISDNSLSLLQSRFNVNERANRLGLLSLSDYQIEQNRIVVALLQTIDELSNKHFSIPLRNDDVRSPASDRESIPKNSGFGSNTSLDNQKKAKKVFISYVQKDTKYLSELCNHLTVLVKSNRITIWNDTELQAGDTWNEAIQQQLNTADIILLLVSVDFIATDYIWNTEMKKALDRHQQNVAKVVPIILRPCSWTDAPFGKLSVLPPKGKPVNGYNDRDEAWVEVVEAIKKIV